LVIVTNLVGLIDYLAFNGMPILGYIYTLGFILPYLAVTVRRLHDLDKSGWWWLIGFIPLVGAIILLVWFCQRGTVGPNRFGPDPLLTSALPPAQPQAIIGR
jgi:uncharacterized membrane protein YhaH (DUF805 family)